jgi:hypothetical protein
MIWESGDMSKADEYRVRAAYCKSRAEEAIDPGFKREFEQLAVKWNDLARQEEVDAQSGFEAPRLRRAPPRDLWPRYA